MKSTHALLLAMVVSSLAWCSTPPPPGSPCVVGEPCTLQLANLLPGAATLHMGDGHRRTIVGEGRRFGVLGAPDTPPQIMLTVRDEGVVSVTTTTSSGSFVPGTTSIALAGSSASAIVL